MCPNTIAYYLTLSTCYGQGFFCDGTRQYGVPAPFSKVKKKIICNVYYYRINDFRLVSTGTYFCTKKPWNKQTAMKPLKVQNHLIAGHNQCVKQTDFLSFPDTQILP